MENDRSIPD